MALKAPQPDLPERDARITELVNAYAGLIRSAVRRVGGSHASLIQDDVQQNVVLALWRQLERGQTIDRPASYIFRAAVRETVRLIRRDRLHLQSPIEEETAAAGGSGDDPHRHVEDRERQEALMECLNTLAPPRQLAVRAHLSGFDVREI